MLVSLPYLSIRWKIIILASCVISLTSALFVWQQHELQSGEFESDQAELRAHLHVIVDHLFQSQADRMQMLGNLFVEQPNVREDILNKQGGKLAQLMELIATDLFLDQGIVAVVFHDTEQKLITAWGDSAYQDNLVPLAMLAANQEKPQTHLECKQICVHQTVLPVSYHGHTIGTVTLISNLEFILNDLHRLTNSDVALFHGKIQDEHAPITGMRLISVSGGTAIQETLQAARSGVWQDFRFKHNQAGAMHQVILIPLPQMGEEQNRFALISDVTQQIQAIEYQTRRNLLRGAAVMTLAMLLLFVMLRPTMRRIHHVSRILPLLGEEKFAQVRENYAARPLGKWLSGYYKDEVDELEALALALADRLEQLWGETTRHADSLTRQALQLGHERDFIAGLLDTAPVLIVSYSADGLIKLANVYALQTCGLSLNEVVEKSYAALFLNISQQMYDAKLSAMKAGEVSRMESAITGDDGSVSYVLWFHSVRAVGENTQPTYLSIGMDITEHRNNEAKIHDLAFYDPLTKLPNRHMLTNNVQHARTSSVRNKSYCALVFIDLDHFKAINDSKGQAVGDQLLIEIAKRLRGNVRGFDTVAHLDSDEFVVLLDELSEDIDLAAGQSMLIVEKLRQVISQPCLVQGFMFHITCSVGISLFSGDEIAADESLRQANIAMSYAKTAGRNDLRFFDPAMQAALETRTSLEADLRDALAQNQFQLFYQIQMNSTGKALGAEALLRWFHPERGLVPPLHFIPVAEETVLILPIGQWVLEKACAQLKSWEADVLTSELQLAVNVSARQFHQADFVTQVLHALENSGANPARLKLELTESIVLDNILDTIEKMHQLKKIGVRFSIDDFGTAYSSLSYLTQLPLDQMKIDQSFVRNIGVKPSDAIIVQTIINMANNLGMEVIAEGVESEAQRHFLEQAHCLAYQGYLFGKPLALEAFTAYLEAGRSKIT